MEGGFIWWSLAFCFCFSWILSRQGNQWLGEQALPGVGWWWCVLCAGSSLSKLGLPLAGQPRSRGPFGS